MARGFCVCVCGGGTMGTMHQSCWGLARQSQEGRGVDWFTLMLPQFRGNRSFLGALFPAPTTGFFFFKCASRDILTETVSHSFPSAALLLFAFFPHTVPGRGQHLCVRAKEAWVLTLSRSPEVIDLSPTTPFTYKECFWCRRGSFDGSGTCQNPVMHGPST